MSVWWERQNLDFNYNKFGLRFLLISCHVQLKSFFLTIQDENKQYLEDKHIVLDTADTVSGR